MIKIKIDFEHCYGIKKVSHEFDFSNKNLFVIYAPNGAMKTSFANAFRDLSEDKPSEDRIFKKREVKRIVTDENGSDIIKDQIFVIEPYNEHYKSSKISTLLVNKALKEEYDRIYADIDEKKEILIKELKASSGLKSNIEETLSTDLTHDPKEFFKSLVRVRQEVFDEKQSGLMNVAYNKIFNDKVLAMLASPDFKEKLSQYMQTYEDLITASTFFKKGIFNHNNASDIAKNLKDNGFFKANHSVYINIGGTKQEVKTEAELEKVIQHELDSILKNAALAKSFGDIDKVIIKNKDTKDFRMYVEQNKFIIPELENLPRFRQKLWVAYLAKSIESYNALMNIYSNGRENIEKIIETAKKEETKWANVINIFNERFMVPFVVTMGNQDDVILNSEAPSIKFKFKDVESNTEVAVEENDLWRILSNGEKRALYILNIIFEVEARKEVGQETLFIVDDIADSFDYKNKYAIVEYLNDIAKESLFYQIILTHNFDFFRTVGSRLDVPRENKLHTIKTIATIKLVQEKYQKNPFATWKENLAINEEMLIASIPFVRNLAEYCGSREAFLKLTKLLHLKPDTDSVTVGDLGAIFKEVLRDKTNLSLNNPGRIVKELIYALAHNIYSETEEVIELEKKIVLSIAIRLKMEEALIKGINDTVFVVSITRNQTIKLIEKYKEKCPANKEVIALAEQVNLMTPENIHINSFMYEPILDMSNNHLKQLYKRVFDFSTEQ